MQPPVHWGAILGMFAVLAAMYVIFPNAAFGFAAVILIILLGYGFRTDKFKL